VQEVKIPSKSLQLEGQVLLELKEQPALVLRSQRRVACPLDDESCEIVA
jgi:hypothetical protein